MQATKAEKLEYIAREIAACAICCRSGLGRCVLGEGDANARVVFVDEAPGKNESKLGHPFAGRAGRMLRRSIRAIGLDESRVFLTNVSPYLPKSGTPTAATIRHSAMSFAGTTGGDSAGHSCPTRQYGGAGGPRSAHISRKGARKTVPEA